MTLSPALTVGFAVHDGAPADVRGWITAELAEFLSSGRRGFTVATEPVRKTPEAMEFAHQVREIIVSELRRQYLLPPDAALGRAFAAANSYLYQKTHEHLPADAATPIQIGATAVVFDGHVATFGHVPPGQMILVEDGLVYALPELESWSPYFADRAGEDAPPLEPLGYGPRIAPMIAQTDLRSGDTIMLCSTEFGRAFANEMAAANASARGLGFLHGRDPDKILDIFRDLVVEDGLNDVAVTVVAFAPVANDKRIRTLGDVGRRARDSFRHGAAASRQLLPAPRARAARGDAPEAVSTVADEGPVETLPLPPSDDPLASGLQRMPRRQQWRAKTLRAAERLVPTRQTTWEPPTEVRQFGVPGAHGVRIYRGRASEMGEESWRNRMPRMPLRQVWIWVFVSILLVAAIAGSGWARERWFVSHTDYRVTLAAVDQSISDARKLSDPTEIDSEYLNAQRELGNAREDGAPESDITPRQQAITQGRDKLHNVIRLDDVTRIGGLPSQLQNGETRVVQTPGGIFMVNGSLYQVQPKAKTIVKVLSEGSKVGKVTVGKLYGVAYDTTGLYTTDGSHVFVYTAESNWQVVALGEINDQGPWPAGPIGSFDSGLYILEAKYKNIYRFDADPEDGSSSAAVDWVQDSDRGQLDSAVDLAIDGRIYVLMDDGHIVTFYKGAQEKSIAPKYLQLQDGEKVVSMVNGPATSFLYVAVTSRSDGRVVVFDKDDKHEYQLELPDGFSTQGLNVKQPFEGLQAITVDEDTGTIYFINGDGIWSARYTLPASALPPSTPAASPTPSQ